MTKEPLRSRPPLRSTWTRTVLFGLVLGLVAASGAFWWASTHGPLLQARNDLPAWTTHPLSKVLFSAFLALGFGLVRREFLRHGDGLSRRSLASRDRIR